MLTPIKIGISVCLLGKKVRYDGGHSHYRYLPLYFSDYINQKLCNEIRPTMVESPDRFKPPSF